MNMTANQEYMYDKKTLEKELQDVKQNLQNILDRIIAQQINRNSSTTNTDKINGIPKTFEEMDWEIVGKLIDEICQLTAELNQVTGGGNDSK